MSPVDRYIRRATAGLPGTARLDTAAELRVHLNQRIEQYLGQGFERAEAEHLAVQQMGPAEPVNRSLLGHVFTPRVGWVVLALLVLGSGGWFGANYLFAPAEVARARSLSADELLPLFGDFRSVELTLPRETQTMFLATVQGDSPLFESGTRFTERAAALRPNQRLTVPVTFGFLNPGLASMDCPEGMRSFASMEGSPGWGQGCLEFPSSEGSWVDLTQDGLQVAHDTWLPLLLFRPSVTVDSLEPGQRSLVKTPQGYVVPADPGTWLVISAYVTRTPFDGRSPQPPAPTATDVIRQRPWLAQP